jgi:cytochrome c
MSGLFVNKVLGALLASGLGFILINKFSNVVMQPDVPEPEKFAYSLAVETETAPVEVVEIAFPSPTWLEGRDAEKGAKVFKKCKACHTVNSGGKDGVGPHLWNIVGRDKSAVAGFGYSDGMRAKGGIWGYEELDAFLTKPKNYIPKTKMSFNGLKKEADRAALIEFLRLAADAPQEQLVAQIQEAVDVPEVIESTVQDAVDAAVVTAGDVVKETVEDVVEETAPVKSGH